MPGLHFDMMERVDQGPRVREETFDNSIFPRVKELAQKYEIKYDPDKVISDDDAMADRLFHRRFGICSRKRVVDP